MGIRTMALRNLGRQKRRTVLLGAAIAFGLAVVTLVNGLSAGMIRSLEDNLSNLFTGQIFITGTEKTDNGKVVQRIDNDAALLKAVKDLKIPYVYESRTSVVPQAGLISDTSTAYLTLYGVDFGPDSFLSRRLSLLEGTLNLAGTDGIIISEGAAKALDVKLGDRLSVQATTETGQQNVVDFTVRGIYRDIGVASSLAGAYADRKQVNVLLNLAPTDYNQFGLYLGNITQVEFWGQKLYDQLKAQGVPLWPRSSDQSQIDQELRTQKWTGTKFLLQTLDDKLSIVRALFSALDAAAFAVLLILYTVVMVGITNTYRMVVHERTREIGTLRALGMQAKEVRRLFLWEAVFLALGGIIAGFIAGAVLLGLTSLFDLSSWKAFTILLRNNHLHPLVDAGSFFVDLVAVTALTAFAASFPARKAARLLPAAALRQNF